MLMFLISISLVIIDVICLSVEHIALVSSVVEVLCLDSSIINGWKINTKNRCSIVSSSLLCKRRGFS